MLIQDMKNYLSLPKRYDATIGKVWQLMKSPLLPDGRLPWTICCPLTAWYWSPPGDQQNYQRQSPPFGYERGFLRGSVKVLDQWLSLRLTGERPEVDEASIYPFSFQILADNAANAAQIHDWIIWRLNRLPGISRVR